MADKYMMATRTNLHFDSPQGKLSIIDIWNVPLQSQKEGRANLDDIAKDLKRKIDAEGAVASFVDESKTADASTHLAFDIVLDVIRVKKTENAAKLAVEKNKALKQKIMEVIERKEGAALDSKPIEELYAELNKLSA